MIEVPLAGSGSDDTSLNAVKTLRNDVVPEVLPRSTAASSWACPAQCRSLDFNELMASRIWYVFAFVFSVAFLLLLVTFRSIVIRSRRSR